MTCSFDKIISDVKTLTIRLKESDETTDSIMKNASFFCEKLKSLNILQDRIVKLTNSDLENDENINYEGKLENKRLEQLRLDNDELKDLLKDYQTALELIMSKYRSEMNEFMHTGVSSKEQNPEIINQNETRQKLAQELQSKYSYLYYLALQTIQMSESQVERLESNIELLNNDNEELRNILGLNKVSSDLDSQSQHQSAGVASYSSGINNLLSSASLLTNNPDEDDVASCDSDASVRTLM